MASKSRRLYHVKGQYSIVKGAIGADTTIWNYVNIQAGARVGARCNICDNVFVENGAVVGNDITIKNNVAVWKGIEIQDAVFVGPSVTFVNDRYPRSKYIKQVRGGHDPSLPYAVRDEEWLEKTTLRKGCAVGANATILCGVEVGEEALVGAGAVVTKNVPARCLVVGNPARIIKRNIKR
jgi:acetyltransferase-like isoleucine patch superfamily enzyme